MVCRACVCEEEERNIADLFGFGGVEGKEKKGKEKKRKVFFIGFGSTCGGAGRTLRPAVPITTVTRESPTRSLQFELLDTEFLFGVGFEICLEKRNQYKFSIPFLYNL